MKFISMQEAVPEKDQQVLTYFLDEDNEPCLAVDTWRVKNGCCSWDTYTDDITHWCPIPELPTTTQPKKKSKKSKQAT